MRTFLLLFILRLTGKLIRRNRLAQMKAFFNVKVLQRFWKRL
ncbi:MAG: hypothetical protein BSOLF_0408 [Candidatus Carbobacillus altaicus]|uniref:Uncharacterized protein n=1 Tax=Candidatus Carbonibacillus altaicus TaxID=2163959 RepID=A0A2R6Y5E3_9BACL|nr:MAG: hypothetical protein BSOLF_0408 [Candidatus Carbobacillus altaicus]